MFEPVSETIRDTSENLTKTLTQPSFKNDQVLENLNSKLLEILNDRSILAINCLMSLLSEITNLENSSQFTLVKDFSANRVNDLLIKNTIPMTLNDNLLTFRDTGKVFEIKGDLLKMKTNKNYNVDLASLKDRKIMYDFAKEMHFDIKATG